MHIILPLSSHVSSHSSDCHAITFRLHALFNDAFARLGIVEPYPSLKAWYEKMIALPPIVKVLTGESPYGEINPYFISPESHPDSEHTQSVKDVEL